MTDLCITVRFLQPYSHGRGEDGMPEWPPSPLRLFQALVASAIGRTFDREARACAVAALSWFELQPPPEIFAPTAVESTAAYRLYVPDNVGDKVARSWSSGHAADLSKYRTEKDVRSLRLGGDAVYFVFRGTFGLGDHLAALRVAARALTHLGWGIDMVAGDAVACDASTIASAVVDHWLPVSHGGKLLRCAVPGTLEALERKHAQFLQRLDGETLRPVSPLTTFVSQPYARTTDPVARPFAAFRLLQLTTGNRCMFEPSRKARDVAAWLRHAVAEVCEGWPFGPIERIVHGHAAEPSGAPYARFSYLPLPTITPRRVEGIARVLVTATPGLEREITFVRRHLAGHELTWQGRSVALLEPLSDSDTVLRRYVAASATWSTVTPVILPGHDDHSAAKAERLLLRSFLQAGLPRDVIDGIQALSWHRTAFLPGVDLSTRYLPPDKVTGLRFHVRVRFATPIAGPLAIGSGRHRGMGVFATDAASA